MSDISMCHGIGCPIKDNCYRHEAKPNEFWQTYFAEMPGFWWEPIGWKCQHYWPTDHEEENMPDFLDIIEPIN